MPEEVTYSKFFISHATEDQRLAEAWQTLIRDMSNAREIPWYSSDPRAGGGILGGEEWRSKIDVAISKADTILVLMTPGSSERPWPVWESGIAHGQSKTLVPVVLFMEPEEVIDPFKKFDVVNGLEKEEVLKLCEAQLFVGRDISEANRATWHIYYDSYSGAVHQEQQQSFTRSLFRDHFHNQESAKKFEGIWDAIWMVGEQCEEEVFEQDAVQLWSTGRRLRGVGLSQKEGLEVVKLKKPEVKHYPLEGVVSRKGWIALSYWSAANIPICGTVLLEEVGTSGLELEGTWEGFTAKKFKDAPSYTRGRVKMNWAGRNWSDWEKRKAKESQG